MKRSTIFLLFTALFISCSGGKKQGLSENEPEKESEQVESVTYEAEEVLDTIIPVSGIKYKGVRKVEPANLPVVIDLANKNPEKGDLDLSQFYNKANFIKLKHPLDPEKGGFFGGATITMIFEQGMSTGSGISSVVMLNKDYIVAGDSYFGYHCYDRSGNFRNTIVTMDEFPKYDSKKREVRIKWSPDLKLVRSFSLVDDNCLFMTQAGKKSRLYFHNIPLMKNYLERPLYGGSPFLIDSKTIACYSYNILSEEPSAFLSITDYKGDTLSSFTNCNPLIKAQKRSYTNPDRADFYYYNNQLTFRQPYNDTVYRIKSEQKLQPAYILNLGSQKLDIQTALYGDKSGKLIPYKWIETENFILIIHTENYDCPNNRNNGSVKFFYSYYDKKANKIYRMAGTAFPNEYLIANSVEGGIPLMIENVRSNGKSLYIGYTKAQLENIKKHKSFASLPKIQQDNITTHLDGMTDQDMLVMILE